MSGKPRRIVLRIDRITVDNPGLDRMALEAALRREVAGALAVHKMGKLSTSSYRERLQAKLPAGKIALHDKIANTIAREINR
ncbi:hypothetical protein [Microbulbifer epialgicus]|uniref:Uncharacterized protein n=1 Tax=Microbulbifer epialgicus TaxID=393907 RepID=A0ABV4NYB8_9GAMM